MSRWQRIVTAVLLPVLLALAVAWTRATAARQDQASAVPRPTKPPAKAAASLEPVRVFFVTNRQRDEGDESAVLFGGRRGEPSLGTCTVDPEPRPVMEGIAQKLSFWVPNGSSDQQIELRSSSTAFWDELVAAVEATSSRDVVIFVHGYSFDFERACDRAAEAQRLLERGATVLLFTWPSNGRATDYVSDQADLEWSVPLLSALVEELVERFGASSVHVLAHSLGSRGVVQALIDLKLKGREASLLGSLVLLAPDLDAQTFVEMLPDLTSLAGRITVYASGNDTPLKISHQLNGSPRLGQAGEWLTVAEGMETVDVTPAGRYQILGHEYFYFHPLVATDLLELVTTGKGAAERAVPRPKRRDELTYWEIAAEDSQ